MVNNKEWSFYCVKIKIFWVGELIVEKELIDSILVEIITKYESSLNLLRNGQQIVAYEKMQGVKSKLYNLLQTIRTEKSESNWDKKLF